MPVDTDMVASVEQLRSRCAEHNAALIPTLREETDVVQVQNGESKSIARVLLDATRADAAVGRMTEPVPVEQMDLRKCLLHPRFGVCQQKASGVTKVRPADHFSWSAASTRRERKAGSVNGNTVAQERMKHQTLDELLALMKRLKQLTSREPGLLKADIDSAFRLVGTSGLSGSLRSCVAGAFRFCLRSAGRREWPSRWMARSVSPNLHPFSSASMVVVCALWSGHGGAPCCVPLRCNGVGTRVGTDRGSVSFPMPSLAKNSDPALR